MLNESARGRSIRLHEIAPQTASKCWPHDALARFGVEDDPDRLANFVWPLHVLQATDAGVGRHWKIPASSQKFKRADHGSGASGRNWRLAVIEGRCAVTTAVGGARSAGASGGRSAEKSGDQMAPEGDCGAGDQFASNPHPPSAPRLVPV